MNEAVGIVHSFRHRHAEDDDDTTRASGGVLSSLLQLYGAPNGSTGRLNNRTIDRHASEKQAYGGGPDQWAAQARAMDGEESGDDRHSGSEHEEPDKKPSDSASVSNFKANKLCRRPSLAKRRYSVCLDDQKDEDAKMERRPSTFKENKLRRGSVLQRRRSSINSTTPGAKEQGVTKHVAGAISLSRSR